MALLQPCDVVDGGVGSGFDAAMIAVYGLMPTDRRILESPCFCSIAKTSTSFSSVP